MDIKRRAIDRAVELRSSDDGLTTVTGYAAVFFDESAPGTEFRLGPKFRERIAPTAFDRALEEQHDVRALFNHDSNFVLGRSAAGTLRLETDDVGLRYIVDLPDTQAGRDVAESIRRGDITGSSFAFEILDERRTDDPEAGEIVYEVRDLRLYDVGPVTYPAYEATSTAVRSDPRFDATIDYRPDNVEVETRFRELRLSVLD